MVFSVGEKDKDEIVAFLSQKGLAYITYENEQKLMLHNGFVNGMEGIRRNMPDKIEQIESDIRQAVNDIYNHRKEDIDETLADIISGFIANEYSW